MRYWKTMLLALFALTAMAEEPRLQVEPRTLNGVPGEPLKLVLTVETDRVRPVEIRIPAASNLVLRTIEKIPIQRTDKGRFIEQRIVLWQGVEAGHLVLTQLVAEVDGATHLFPAVEITIDPVVVLDPPRAKEGE